MLRGDLDEQNILKGSESGCSRYLPLLDVARIHINDFFDEERVLRNEVFKKRLERSIKMFLVSCLIQEHLHP